MQRNLEQLRALHALRFWRGTESREQTQGSDGGNVVAKLGPMILECGLLATISFAQQKQGGHAKLIREIGRYLGSQGDDGRRLLPAKAETLDEFLRHLTAGKSDLLRLATAEALLYVGYLKRLAPPKEQAVPPSQNPLTNPVAPDPSHAD